MKLSLKQAVILMILVFTIGIIFIAKKCVKVTVGHTVNGMKNVDINFVPPS